MDNMKIVDFYKGKDILITGGLGYLGKVLIEKLLRSCPDLNRLFVLIRARTNKTPQQRLDEVISNSELFSILREKNPAAFLKLIVVGGDVSEENLGLSRTDQEMVQNVSIIFHSAATVRFNEPMKVSVLVNTKGTYEMMKFAERLSNIKAVVHVSTTYCNLETEVLEEKVYTPYADWKKMIDSALNSDEEVLDSLLKSYSNGKHNSYTLSKHLAEHIVNDFKDKIPVLIFRPAIVIPIVSDPLPGWVDNWNGPVGLCAGIGAGVVRTNYCGFNVKLQATPVDVSARVMIIAALKIALEKRDIENLTIYNCTTRMPMKSIARAGLDMLLKNPIEKTLWAPDETMTTNRYYFYIRTFLLQLLPALFLDMLLTIFRQKPFLFKLQKRVITSGLIIGPFLSYNWKFYSKNTKELEKCITPSEFEEFGFNHLMNVNIDDYMGKCLTTVKRILLHEPAKCSKKHLIKFKIMVIIDKIIRFVFYLGLFYYLTQSWIFKSVVARVY